jgi:hypothetical protein
MAVFRRLRHRGGLAWKSTAACLCAALAVGGCTLASQPLAVALAGAGTSSAIGQTMNGTVYRTFTAPPAEVKAAALDTLSLMGFRVDSFATFDNGEIIRGSAINRTVEVELEPISSRATRMRVATKNGSLFYDGATATEIVIQTEKALGVNEANASVGASRRPGR